MDDKIIVKSKALSRAFSISDRRVRQLSQEGVVIKESKGNYDLIQSTINYINYLKASNVVDESKKENDLDPEIERAKKIIIDRKIAELDYSLKIGELHHSDDVKRVLTDMIIRFRSQMRAIPSKLAMPLSGESNPKEIEKMMSGEIDQALTELSEYNHEDFYKGEYMNLEDDDEEEDITINTGDTTEA